jgi:hypothetical protein
MKEGGGKWSWARVSKLPKCEAGLTNFLPKLPVTLLIGFVTMLQNLYFHRI